MDAYAMVSYGKNGLTVPTQHTCTTSTRSPALSTTTSASDFIIVTSGDCSSINYLEHVVADITFSYTRLRGVTKLYLVSPSAQGSNLPKTAEPNTADVTPSKTTTDIKTTEATTLLTHQQQNDCCRLNEDSAVIAGAVTSAAVVVAVVAFFIILKVCGGAAAAGTPAVHPAI
ncbi:PCSK5 [Mytilus edulis]|uniref:PCSK5 n=1 Tax=Mytilus edulis TaxID=6550 RepID=A0A8S3TEC0_MYTED|nr:PCSK5 [Mytilus edulis]